MEVDVLLEKGLELLSKHPELLQNRGAMELGLMPNIKFPTMGGEVWWNDLAEYNGWRVQRNSATGHCRILDPEDVRHAWGGETAIMDFFKKIVKD